MNQERAMEHYVFPQDLIEGIKSRWTVGAVRSQAELPSDSILQRLLEICYHASLRTAEHRPVHCVVAYAPVSQLPAEGLLLLERAVPLSDDQIVRLAPVADIRRTLIGCDCIDGELQIWGLFEHGKAWVQFAGDPPESPVEETHLTPDCLTITLEQPGSLSVSCGHRGLVRLRGGRIIVPRENPLRDPSAPLGRFFHRLVDDLRQAPFYHEQLNHESAAAQRSLLDIYTTSVAAMLERIRLRREGGSIVITRAVLDADLAQITYRVGQHTGLADEIVSYYAALRKAVTTPHSPTDAASQLETTRAEMALRRASQQLSRGISQISLLAGVDGAVLLNDHLGIQGFGVRFPVLLPVGASVLDATTGVEHPCDQWGLRHQSVFSVCQRCEHVIGLIVSQDGGVKAVKSDQGQLHLWDGILD